MYHLAFTIQGYSLAHCLFFQDFHTPQNVQTLLKTIKYVDHNLDMFLLLRLTAYCSQPQINHFCLLVFNVANGLGKQRHLQSKTS